MPTPRVIAGTFREVMARKGWRGFFGVLRVLKLYIWDAYILVLCAQLGPLPFVAFFQRRRGAHIGRDVLIDRTALLDGLYPELITIEDDVRLGPGATIVCHTTAGEVLRKCGIPLTVKPVHVRKHSMIGANATILPGVTVGEGGFVAAGAVVSQDVPEYTIVAGNPARPVRKLTPSNGG